MFRYLDVLGHCIAHGGITLEVRALHSSQPLKAFQPSAGFCFSPYKARERVIERPLRVADLVRYVAQNQDLLSRPFHHLGVWEDASTGYWYLDVSVVTADRSHAVAQCRKHQQLAFWDIANCESVVLQADQFSHAR